MRYMMRSGVLYEEETHHALAKIKQAAIGTAKQIYDGGGRLLLEAGICPGDKASRGDVRSTRYVLTVPDGPVRATAAPGYAAEDDPDVVGWPICRMPRVDHAAITVGGADYRLTMHSSQNYSLKDTGGAEVLRIMHRGLSGGWRLEDDQGFSPELLCGLFVFCRYIELENEFLIV